ncbi:GNAT family N-acetyltransferase [Pannonibacter phragmitetus]|uniref:GNAT family N-acetyltransferase n=1 Tax=Pannonibacter phragmitetus TaxID=121719 RepID=UPI00067A9427|nr:N-acetyltransferase [Pannonibacter phragmitetus]
MTAAQNSPAFTVRPLTQADEQEAAGVITAAFNQPSEARLVYNLRHCGALLVELVAQGDDGRLLGHVAFSRVTGAGAGHRLQISCLAPVSVLPELQKLGIGSALINAGLNELRQQGEDLVLGPPAYYPRFGFDAELAKQVQAPYAGAAFMALALTEAGREHLPVEVSFATPFQEFE